MKPIADILEDAAMLIDCPMCDGNAGFSSGDPWPFDWLECARCRGTGEVDTAATLARGDTA